jgi:hypothetical protein
MRSFFMSIYDVSYFFMSFIILLFSLKNKPLPSFKWIKSSNNTHGYIRATVDFSVGPKPTNVVYFHARTLNSKRFVEKTLF